MSERSGTRVGWRDALIAIALATVWVAAVRPGSLALPYFWDAADVYVPGAKWVAEHGFDVTPGVFPDDYSRGHPPLFYLLAAVAFRLFGAGPVVGHLVVLPFTVLALAGTYLLGASLFGRAAGASAAAILATTPLAMSIGNMMLPEMPLTALAVLSLLAFARGRLGIAAALGVIAVWTKETGIFAAAAIGVGVLVDAWRRRALRDGSTWARAALAAVPLAALIGFFVWQKAYAGYYIFPHHQNLFSERPFEARNLGTVWPSLLLWHGRWIVLGASALALVVSVGRRGWPPPLRVTPRRTSVVAACLALVLFNAIFFTKMFWLERYALPAHPALLVAACGGLFFGLKAMADPRIRALAAHVPVLASALIGVLSLHSPTPADAAEQSFAYADAVQTHERAAAALHASDAPVLTTWPLTVELSEPYLGYTEHAIRTENLRYVDPATVTANAIVVDAASSGANGLREEAARRGMRRVAVFQVGLSAPVELYRPSSATHARGPRS